jgi:two-component SAPR family response regulator
MTETKNVLLPKVLGIYPYMSIVILTDQSISDIEKEDKLLNAQYLVKPIDPERLLDCVGAILGKKSISNHNNLSDRLIINP